MNKPCRRFLLVAALFLTAGLARAQSSAPEYVSPAGVQYFAQPDPNATVAEAEKKLAADPNNPELVLALGRAQGRVWHFHDAIATFTRGIALAPNDARFFVLRGHRHISTRQFDKAVADFEWAAALDPQAEGLWYHFGLVRYLRGEFDKAAAAYEKVRAAAKTDSARIAPSDWLYMSLRRAGKTAEAAKVLERITPEMKVGADESAYFTRLLFYKGLKPESALLPAEPAADASAEINVATLAYGVGNWHLYNGNAARAREYFHRILSSKAWAAFAFIAAEVDSRPR